MAKIFILGENSFVGKHLFTALKHKHECFAVSRKEIDFLNEKTFSNIDFSGSVIIDCININNGNAEEIEACNVTGFIKFCDHLSTYANNFNYVYVSTISTISEETVKTNAYVASKKKAEDFLIASKFNYQIVRLSYPIGKGENKTRLISRLIGLLKENKEVKIQDVQINLNNINDVCLSISDNLLKNKIVFISSNIYTSLYDTVTFLKKKLNSTSNLIKIDATQQFTPKSESPFIPSLPLEDTLVEML